MPTLLPIFKSLLLACFLGPFGIALSRACFLHPYLPHKNPAKALATSPRFIHALHCRAHDNINASLHSTLSTVHSGLIIPCRDRLNKVLR